MKKYLWIIKYDRELFPSGNRDLKFKMWKGWTSRIRERYGQKIGLTSISSFSLECSLSSSNLEYLPSAFDSAAGLSESLMTCIVIILLQLIVPLFKHAPESTSRGCWCIIFTRCVLFIACHFRHDAGILNCRTPLMYCLVCVLVWMRVGLGIA